MQVKINCNQLNSQLIVCGRTKSKLLHPFFQQHTEVSIQYSATNSNQQLHQSSSTSALLRPTILAAAAVFEFSYFHCCSLTVCGNLKMSKARETIKENKGNIFLRLGSWSKKFCSSTANFGLTWGSWVCF